MKRFLLLLFAFSCQADAAVLGSDLSLISPDLLADHAGEPDWDLAWHGRLAGYGDPDSCFFIAQVYEQGRLLPRNMPKALKYYRTAAEKGHIESCMRLANLLPDEAETWYTRAASRDDPQAQIKLAQFYEARGDIPQAIFWLEKAMRYLFPHTADLTTVSPDLARLKAL